MRNPSLPGRVQRPQGQENRGMLSEGWGPWGLGNWTREGFPDVGDSGRWADKVWHVTGAGEEWDWGLLAKPWGHIF